MSLSEVYHVYRTVRKASALGAEVGKGEAGKSDFSAVSGLQSGFEVMRMGSLASKASLLGGPGLAGATIGGLATLAVLSYFSQFIQPGGQIIMPDPNSGISYADQTRQALLVRIYGQQKGNMIWQEEFTSRTHEIDLRTKFPG